MSLKTEEGSINRDKSFCLKNRTETEQDRNRSFRRDKGKRVETSMMEKKKRRYYLEQKHFCIARDGQLLKCSSRMTIICLPAIIKDTISDQFMKSVAIYVSFICVGDKQ